MCVFAGGPYLPLLQGFRKLFPGIHPTPLVASVLFFTPIIRDFVSWCGVRQVWNHGSSLEQFCRVPNISARFHPACHRLEVYIAKNLTPHHSLEHQIRGLEKEVMQMSPEFCRCHTNYTRYFLQDTFSDKWHICTGLKADIYQGAEGNKVSDPSAWRPG